MDDLRIQRLRHSDAEHQLEAGIASSVMQSWLAEGFSHGEAFTAVVEWWRAHLRAVYGGGLDGEPVAGSDSAPRSGA